RTVRNEQERTLGYMVDKPDDEDRGRLHVDRGGANRCEVVLELVIMFPDAAIGGVNGAGPVIEPLLDDHGRDRLLEAERRECGDFRWHIVVAGPFSADGGD